jgi:hypothetical protein
MLVSGICKRNLSFSELGPRNAIIVTLSPSHTRADVGRCVQEGGTHGELLKRLVFGIYKRRHLFNIPRPQVVQTGL